MKVSTMLSRILSESLLVAKDFHHEFFTPEHVLATAIRDEFVEQLLQNSGADTKELFCIDTQGFGGSGLH